MLGARLSQKTLNLPFMDGWLQLQRRDIAWQSLKRRLSKNRKLKDSKGKQTVKTYCVMFGMCIQNTFHCLVKCQKDYFWVVGNPCSIFFSNSNYFEDCVVLQCLWYNLPRSLFLSEELNFQQKLKTSLWWIACVTSVSVRFRWEKEEQGSKTARWKPKIPFHGLFLLRNQTETLATQLFDQKLGWIK